MNAVLPILFRKATKEGSMEREINTFDGDYYKRYAKRNMRKTRSILKNVGNVESILDIGCNYGYVLRAFLRKEYGRSRSWC